jgi:hypothetical protein
MTLGFRFDLKVVARCYSRPMLLNWRAGLLRKLSCRREHDTSTGILVSLSGG